MSDSRGQALVETVWLIPLASALVGAVLSAGVWISIRAAADSAAHAAAVAVIEQSDPLEAARRSVPGWGRGAIRLERSPRLVRVRVAADMVPGPLRPFLSAESTIVTGTVER
ncbi:MAG: hypothetical protein WCO96_07585 [Actinomycetes bacterium]